MPYVSFHFGIVLGKTSIDFQSETIISYKNKDKLRIWFQLDKSDIDEGILVDESMRTSNANVYACGDVCTVNWKQQSSTWKQASPLIYFGC